MIYMKDSAGSEARFVNEFDYDDEAISEVMRYYVTRTYLTRLVIFEVILVAVLAIILRMNLATTVVLAVFVILLCVVSYAIVSRMSIRREQQRLQLLSPDKSIRHHIEISGDKVLAVSANRKITLGLSDIKKIGQTSNYIIITVKGALIVPLRKDGFIVGDADDCLSYLHNR